MPINKISSLHEKLKFKLFADAKHRFWLQQYLENNEMIKKIQLSTVNVATLYCYNE